MNRRAFLAVVAAVAVAPRKLWSMFPIRPTWRDNEPSGMRAVRLVIPANGYSLIADESGFELWKGTSLLRTIPVDAVQVGDTLTLRGDGQVSINGGVT